jgi:acetylornithine deacetylase/succinyl-diaminopimelate desuccinylase-like protein
VIDSGIKSLDIQGISLHQFGGKDIPALYVYVIEGSPDVHRNLLLYGHLDKQPWFEGWDEGLGPITPVIRDGKLYGRGSADDGYSAFACALSVKAA